MSVHTTLEIADRWSDLDQLRGAWSALLADSDDDQPTLSPTWLETWWTVFGASAGRRLRSAAVFDEGELIGLAPLLSRRRRHRGIVPVRRLELLGSGEEERDEICSDYLNVISRRGRERSVAEAIVDGLLSGRFGAWDEVVFDAMDASSRMTSELGDALERAGVALERRALPAAPYIPLPDSWDGYLSALSRSRRYKLRRAIRDLERWAGGDLMVGHVHSEHDLDQGLDILIDLHGRRWRADGKNGAFASERFRRFHRTAAAELLRRGCLDLRWLSVGDRPIAALYNIVWRGRVQFYQSGREVDLPKRLKPGVVAHALAIQDAIAAGRREYDFLSGESRYKRELSLALRPMVAMRAAHPRSLAAAAERLLERGVATARRARASFADLQRAGDGE